MLPNEVKPYSESYQWLWRHRENYQWFRFNIMNMWVPDEPKAQFNSEKMIDK